jgi:hypothetical protein
MAQATSQMGKPRPRVKRSFYRNGQLREETHFLGSTIHGPHRTWHHNGQLSSEEFYDSGLLHGLCRQWNRRGRLLGSYRMKHGMGIQQAWFQNGRLQFETSTATGKFTGRTRVWLQDGTLVSEQYAIENRNVSLAAYVAAAGKHPDYPRYSASKDKLKPLDADEIERREFQLQVKWLLSQRNRCEALAWLDAGAQKRSLGQFNLTQGRQLVQKCYDAGALQVVAVNLYDGKSGRQYSDALVLKLPSEKPARLAIRQLLAKLAKKLRAGVVPAQDCGEEFIFASFE